MKLYQQIISEATGVTNPAALAWIEDHMRHEIFHSTLDWQSRSMLEKAAREAWHTLRFLGSPAGRREFPEAAAAAVKAGAL